jgi:thymidine phosphorylase
MVSALGGPADFVERAAKYLPQAPVQRAVLAERGGWVAAMATRDIGLLVIELGGGRRVASDRIDHRVGLSGVLGVARRVEAGDVLATVHAADEPDAAMACRRLQQSIGIVDRPVAVHGVVLSRVDG